MFACNNVRRYKIIELEKILCIRSARLYDFMAHKLNKATTFCQLVRQRALQSCLLSLHYRPSLLRPTL